MSEHAHDHSGAFGRVAWFWGILGATELALGTITSTGALMSDGIHYLSDCVVLLITSLFVGWIERLLAHRHFFRHNLRIVSALLIYGATIFVVGLVGLVETYRHVGNGGLQLTLGLIGIGGNTVVRRFWRHLLHHADKPEAMTLSANLNHVKWDIASSSAIALAGLFSLFYSTHWWSFGAASIILVFMLIHNIPEMIVVGKQAHRQVNCETPVSS